MVVSFGILIVKIRPVCHFVEHVCSQGMGSPKKYKQMFHCPIVRREVYKDIDIDFSSAEYLLAELIKSKYEMLAEHDFRSVHGCPLISRELTSHSPNRRLSSLVCQPWYQLYSRPYLPIYLFIYLFI